MKNIYALLLTFVCSLGCLLSLNAQSLEFSNPTSVGAPGDIVTSSVVARDFGTPVAYQVGIVWDPAVAAFSSISNIEAQLASSNDFTISLADTAMGQIRVFYSSFVSPITLPNPATLFDLSLRIRTTGNTNVMFGSIGSFTKEYNGDPSLPTITNNWSIDGSGGGGNPPTPCDGLTGPSILFSDTTVVSGNAACVHVYASDITTLNGFTFSILSDPTAVVNLDTANVNPLIGGGLTLSNNNATVTFASSGGADITLSDCELLFDICFDTQGGSGSSDIGVDDGASPNFSNSSGPITVTTADGTVTLTGGTPPTDPCDGLTTETIVFGDTTIMSGTRGCVPVYASNFIELASFNFFFEFDASILSNLSVENVFAPLSGDLTFANNAVIYSTSTGNNVMIPECQVLFDVCFDATGPSSTSMISLDENQAFEFAQTPSGPITPIAELEGTVTVTGGMQPMTPCDGITTETIVFGDTTVVTGMRGCTPVYASNFDELASFNFFFEFDASILSNLSVENVFAPLAGDLTFANNGVIYSNGMGNNVMIPECQVLFDVCFDATGPSSTSMIGFDESRPFEFAKTPTGPITPIAQQQGTVTVTGGMQPMTPCDGITTETIVFGDTTVVTGMRGCTPVYASNFDELTSFNFFFEFDASILSNLSVENVFAPLAGDLTFANNGVIYSNGMGNNVMIPECQVLFDVCFDATGPTSTSMIGFDESRPFEFAKTPSGPITPIAQQQGTVTVTGGMQPMTPCDGITTETIVFGDTTVVTGMRGCTPVYASNFDELTSFNFFFEFDASILSNLSVENVFAPLAGDLTFANNGVIYSNGMGNNVMIPECQVLFDVCFDATGPTSTSMIGLDENRPFEFAKTPTGPITPIAQQQGTVTVTGGMQPMTPCDGITTETIVFGDTTVVSGMRGCTPVYASNFDELTSFNFFFEFDASILSNLSVENVFAPLAGDLTFANNGVIYSNGMGNNVMIPECQVLFDVCFDATGPSSTSMIGFDESRPFEFAKTPTGPITPIAQQQGTVTVTGGMQPMTPCDGITTETIVFGDTTVVSGMRGCTPVYASNFDELTSFNFFFEFDASILSNLSVENVFAPLAGDLTFANNGVIYSNGMGNNVMIPECQLLFDVCFDATGPSSTSMIGFDESRPFEFAKTPTGPITPIAQQQGTVTVIGVMPPPPPCDTYSGPTISIEQDSAAMGETVCLSIIGYQLGDVTGFTLDFDADAAVGTFADTSNVNAALRGSLSVDAATGTITFAPATAVNLDACDTLMQICYLLVGTPQTSSPVTLGGASVVNDASGTVSFTEIDGSIKVTGMVPCPSVMVDPTATFVSCNGDSDGTITLAVSGGDGTYTFMYDDGPTTQNRTGLSAGSYRVTVTSCGGAEQTTVSVLVGEPTELRIVGNTTNIACNGDATGAIDITPMGGTAPYTYVWTGPGVDVGIQDQSGLIAGMYSVTVTDDNGCTATESFTLTENPTLVVNVTTNQPSPGLMDGSIELSVAGGAGGYTYMWTGPGVDPNNQDQFGLGAGDYTVVVSDQLGCTFTRTYTLEEGAPALSVMTTATCLNSANGTIDLTVVGGIPPYTFNWSNGLPNQEDQTGLAAGTYTVTVTDNAGKSATISATVGTLPVANLSANITPSSGAADGAIDLDVTGGSGAGFTYMWSTGATTQDISMLATGQYTVTVTDVGTMCTYTGVYDVPVDPVTITVSTAVTPVSCNSANGGTCNGTFSLDVLSAVYPITVTFANGSAVGLPASQNYSSNATQTFTGLCPGTFDVLITDAASTTFSRTGLTIGEPMELLITAATIRPVIGAGAANGGVDISVAGGTPGYSYQWSNGATSQDLSGVPTGNYTVQITDANGCVLSSTTYTVQRLQVTSAVVMDVLCAGDLNGSIDIEVAGAAGPFTYLWSNGTTMQDLTGVSAGTYTVQITDQASGASFSETYTIGAQSFIDASVQVTSNFNGAQVSCPDATDGSASAGTGSPVGEVRYLYSTGATTPTVTGLGAGSYTLTIVDSLGCASTEAFEITAPPAITANLLVNNIKCNGEENGRVIAQPSGGTIVDGPYVYEWSTGDFTQDISGLAAGTYSVIITDNNGCSEEFTTGVAEPDPITVDFEVTPAASGSTGSIELFPMGGTAPYTYDWQGRDDTSRVLRNLPFGDYTVFVTDANNCEGVTLNIRVMNPGVDCFDATDVITPGLSDGLNDVFMINCIEDFADNSVEIYNRWGQRVYNASGYDNNDTAFRGFNGTNLLPEGGYFYVLRYRDANGDEQLTKGSFNLIR